ncbi:MAG: alanine dehydrogenase [Bacillota bacterium]
MRIGVPKEVKADEQRVGLTPAGVMSLTRGGHAVLVETQAGAGSGISDEEYAAAGACIVYGPEEVYGEADLIVKVKEPLPSEHRLLRPGQVLFTYLHLAADRRLAEALVERGVVAIAYETVEAPDGSLPLLAPMSEVAGRMSVQIGARLLEKRSGGRGVLLGGVPGVPPAQVVIVGGGVVGTNAAKVARGMGASVCVFDVNAARLRYVDDLFRGTVTTRMSNPYDLAVALREADLLIGAVLVPGAKAPQVVSEEMVAAMRPGSVIVDVAIDQGGCVATVDRITTHSQPTFVKYGVVHYSVPNIPGAVPRTSTFALTNVTLPYVVRLANLGWREAALADPGLAKGLNVVDGDVTHPAVAAALDMPYTGLAG